MILTSSAFENSGDIPAKYTCDGDNISPPLKFIGVPQEAQSLALVVSDPDAPSGDWTHWILFNIDPKIAAINEGVVPEGAKQGQNTSGDFKYEGPCPPSGAHRYFFRLYALDKKIESVSALNKEMFMQIISGHTIAQAELMGQYKRK
jgi:Raf kinase inhibitor-like YbhB/YbcL family protein